MSWGNVRPEKDVIIPMTVLQEKCTVQGPATSVEQIFKELHFLTKGFVTVRTTSMYTEMHWWFCKVVVQGSQAYHEQTEHTKTCPLELPSLWFYIVNGFRTFKVQWQVWVVFQALLALNSGEWNYNDRDCHQKVKILYQYTPKEWVMNINFQRKSLVE